ncbi:hypothetical protein Zmor_016935 [Zophobas morio]|uniref:Uncharacterized protein n=1 Tax=Zophobas morio TaxID=2755281 RepID=A0AA38MCA2_9CUCU|nr:hypothetical protein Zmor_016935 [Zophobas morio]
MPSVYPLIKPLKLISHPTPSILDAARPEARRHSVVIVASHPQHPHAPSHPQRDKFLWLFTPPRHVDAPSRSARGPDGERRSDVPAGDLRKNAFRFGYGLLM